MSWWDFIVHKRNGVNAEEIAQESLESAFKSAIAVRSGPPIREFTDAELLLALQRKWCQVWGNDSIPETIPVLERVIPSGLDERERFNFINGSLEESKACFIKTFNSSWTKAELREKAAMNGVSNALQTFDTQARDGLDLGIKHLTD